MIDNKLEHKIVNTLEKKDRTYVLKTESKPISYILASRHTKNKPLLWYDEKNGIQRALRYASNQKSPFEDEQDGNAIVTPIMLIDGVLFVPKEDVVLQWLLDLHPDKGTVFEELNPLAKAREAMEKEDLIYDAWTLAKEADLSIATAILRIYTTAKLDNMTSEEIRHDLVVYAKNNPTEFLQAIKDPILNKVSTAKKGLDSGILEVKGSEIFLKTKNKREKIGTKSPDEKAETAIASFFNTDAGEQVEELVNRHTS
jgi:hypothetical protein